MKTENVFFFDGLEYVVALCAQTKSGNAALLLSSDENRCITVSDLNIDGLGGGSWKRGYCAVNYGDAVSDYFKRIEDKQTI